MDDPQQLLHPRDRDRLELELERIDVELTRLEDPDWPSLLKQHTRIEHLRARKRDLTHVLDQANEPYVDPSEVDEAFGARQTVGHGDNLAGWTDGLLELAQRDVTEAADVVGHWERLAGLLGSSLTPPRFALVSRGVFAREEYIRLRGRVTPAHLQRLKATQMGLDLSKAIDAAVAHGGNLGPLVESTERLAKLLR